ncbi:hypothetical protein HOLleu_42387 [Holothuria leucospilota]|uniref:Uncharacterized protein n=1 Tax=Holothuria leucospilota TaxID=206669 RepID=A0A9Q1BBM5_HOLLE|nr:hypothetical protein HOLleu_42387 [Holothuria leucospilota]
MIRLHYGFQTSGSHFLDLNDIKLEVDERYEDLYQRLCAFIEDSLLTPESNNTHHGATITEEEELTPTLENFIVLTWLRLINPELPKLVKQRYGPELRSRTLASLKPEISQALDSLVSEINSNVTAMRASASFDQARPKSKPLRRKICPLCKEVKRPHMQFPQPVQIPPRRGQTVLVEGTTDHRRPR